MGVGSQTTNAFALGPNGSLYLTGTRGSARGLCWEIAFTRLSPDASAAIYSDTIPTGMANGFFGGSAIAVDSSGSAYVGGDNRGFVGPARGAILKFDPQGVPAGAQAIAGYISALAVTASEVVLTGDGVIGILATTRDSPPACVSADGYSTAPYVA